MCDYTGCVVFIGEVPVTMSPVDPLLIEKLNNYDAGLCAMDPQDLETMLGDLRRTKDEIEDRLGENKDKDMIQTTQAQDSSGQTSNNGNMMNSFGDDLDDYFDDDYDDDAWGDDDPTMECDWD